MAVRFEHQTFIEAPIELVFDLSLDIDVHLASMAESGERAIAGVTTGRIGLNEEVTWRAKHRGIRFTMTSRVTKMDRPHRFVDQQVEGPFRSFHHEHFFEEKPGGTLMVDRVRFRTPYGFVGRLAERFVLEDYLSDLVVERNEYLKKEAERRAAAEAVPPAE